MTILRLEFIQLPHLPIDLRAVVFDSGSIIKVNSLERQSIRYGNSTIPLGDICRVSRKTSTTDLVEIHGSTTWIHHLGEASCSEIIVHGPVGRWTGAGMKGGRITILGDAGEGLGAGMSGGEILVEGNVSSSCGSRMPGNDQRMSGGMIVINGNAGSYLGQGMRRGVIVVKGRSGDFTGVDMLAGTIFVAGNTGKCTGLNMRRGSIVTARTMGISAGFLYAGKIDAGWLGILFKQLTQYDSIRKNWETARIFDRWTGDHLEMGKGELILYEPSE